MAGEPESGGERKSWWGEMKERYEGLLQEYGTMALGTYLALFVLTFAGFYTALQAGFEVSSAAGTASVVGGAYAATKLSQPVRIGATLVLTPAVAWGYRQLYPAPAPAPEPAPPTSTASPKPE